MEIRTINNIYLGFDGNLTIMEFYKNNSEFFKDYSVLITCLDSSRDLKKLTKWVKYLEDFGIKFEVIGKAFFFNDIFSQKLFILEKTFYHFDEIYFFKNKRPTFSPDEQFTSEIIEFNGSVPNKFFEIMNKIGAERFLSDGCGLNMASKTPLK